jgi:hypothetical protein
MNIKDKNQSPWRGQPAPQRVGHDRNRADDNIRIDGHSWRFDRTSGRFIPRTKRWGGTLTDLARMGS